MSLSAYALYLLASYEDATKTCPPRVKPEPSLNAELKPDSTAFEPKIPKTIITGTVKNNTKLLPILLTKTQMLLSCFSSIVAAYCCLIIAITVNKIKSTNESTIIVLNTLTTESFVRNLKIMSEFSREVEATEFVSQVETPINLPTKNCKKSTIFKANFTTK